MPSVSALLLSPMIPGRFSVRTWSSNRISPPGLDRFLRYLIPPSRNTLSGRLSPSTSTSASRPLSSECEKPTLTPTEFDLPDTVPTPTYRWPPPDRLVLAFTALASPAWFGVRLSAPLDRPSPGEVQLVRWNAW